MFELILRIFALSVIVCHAASIEGARRFVAVDPSLRVDCAPDPNVYEDVCRQRGCSWSPVHDVADNTVPWCHYPPNTGYVMQSGSTTNARLTKASDSPNNPFGGDTSDLNFNSYSIGDAARIVIAADDSFAPSFPLNKEASIKAEDSLIVKTTTNDFGIFSFSVERKSNGQRLWDTSIGGMLFGKQYIQLATLIPTNKIYGFGEHTHQSILHDLTRYTTWAMFARDQPPDAASNNNWNLYGVHNFYLAIEDDGKAHGVFVLNTNAQEVTTGPGPHLTYRAIGGGFEIFVFPGPKPEDVIAQYQQVIGTPYLPAYWAFGYQLCHYGIRTFQRLKDVVDRVTDAQIPFDTIQADIDYMDRYKDFTLNNEWGDFPEFTKQLQVRNLHLTIMIDPAIQVNYDSFQRAKDQNANFISWPDARFVPHDVQDQYPLAKDTNYMLAKVVDERNSTFPRINKMNEPSNFGTNSDHPWYYDSSDHPNDKPLFCPSSGPDAYYDVPPFHTQAGYQWGGYDAKLSANTVCMFAVVNRGQQRIYDVKNVYGLYEIIATRDALLQTTGKRGQVISRSTFPSAGHYGGHWLGDNSARWEDLRSAIIGAQEFNMFGITHVGSDVCGFLGNTTEELCLRWQQAGAFHSFFRNHNDIKSIDQDPPQWSSVAAATRTANLFRYRHLSYLYTLHFASSLRGGTVVRPVFFEYPTDFNAYDLSHQFMWGNAMLVAPAVYANVDEIPVYLPYGSSWYPLYGSKYGVLAGNGKRIVEAPRNSTAPVFARCGHVVPRQEAALTTMGTHENDFQLLITLPKTVLDGKDATATGELFWDDGVSAVQAEQDLNNFEHYHFNFKFTITNKKPQLEITLDRKAARKIFIPSIEEIEILGYPLNVDFNSVKVNGNDAHIPIQDSSYDSDRKILLIRRPESGFVFLSDLLDKWVITWNNQ